VPGAPRRPVERRPEWAPSDVDIDRPSISRIWDWFLGGSHNFAVDREVAKKTLELMPEGPMMARINRAFLARAVRWCVSAGVTQFLDIGSGIPTAGNVHEIAQHANPACRVVYVDIDPVAVTHTRLLLGEDERVAAIYGDMRRPETILDAPELPRILDLTQPVALVLVALLHFISDADDPIGILSRFRSVLPPGSCLVLAHGSRNTDGMPRQHLEAAKENYERAVAQVSLRSRVEIEALFTGFELVEPGVVWLADWHPDEPEAGGPPRPKAGYGGVGRKL
jgi:SAM-dependent methyltransferase